MHIVNIAYVKKYCSTIIYNILLLLKYCKLIRSLWIKFTVNPWLFSQFLQCNKIKYIK